MQLPLIKNTADIPTSMPRWKSLLDPVLANPLNSMLILNNVNLSSGVNVINTGLTDKQQGWIVLDINAAVTIYRSAPFASLTLTLTASAPCIVSLGVF